MQRKFANTVALRLSRSTAEFPSFAFDSRLRTWAECRGVQTQVSTANGTFTIPNVPLNDWGENLLKVTVTDVSGNSSVQQRSVFKEIPGAAETFKHDGNGNLTNWISGTTNWVYEWDWADRLTKVSSNGVVVLENWYDAASHRIGKAELIGSSTARFVYLYDGWDIVGISSGGNGLYETYTRGVALAGDIGGLVAVTRNAFNQRYYLHNNHRGDVTHVRSGAGTLTTYRYSAFGQLVGTTGPNLSRFKFSSKEHERSCNLYYYGYRFYAPQWQRWISRDPLISRGDFIAKTTLRIMGRSSTKFDIEVFSAAYMFVHNQPTRMFDPDGFRGYWSCVGKVLWCEALSVACPAGAVLGVAACLEACANTVGLVCACCWASLPAAIGAVCMEAYDCWAEAAEDGCVAAPPAPPSTWEPPGIPW